MKRHAFADEAEKLLRNVGVQQRSLVPSPLFTGLNLQYSEPEYVSHTYAATSFVNQ